MNILLSKLNIYLHKHFAYPKETFQVHCGQCHWWGLMKQMKTVLTYVTPASFGRQDEILSKPVCPICLSPEWLEYKEN